MLTPSIHHSHPNINNYSFDQNEEADLVERSVSLALETGKRTSDIMSAGCQEVGTKEMTKTVIRKMDELAR